MDDIRTAAVAMAALELLPAEPSDLSAVLSDAGMRAALVGGDAAVPADGLLAYLRDGLDHGRVEAWEKRLDRLGADDRALPVLSGDADYPVLLAGCWDRPPVLFVRGALATGGAVAVVGSRTAAAVTVDAAAQVARAVTDAGLSVVSGLAAGVDTAAHAAAVDAGGHTVAVMGTGIRRVFPEQNAVLAGRVAASGALVSQFVPDAPRTSTTFLRRNCVIAGIAAASVVMDGQDRSGSRHQAEQAVRYGRPVVLWEPALDRTSWARDMVDNGDAVFAGSVDEVLVVVVGGAV